MIAAIWGALTSRTAGPVATAGCLALALLCVGQCTAKDMAKAEAAKLSDAITKPVTGWSARLAICHARAEKAEGEVKDQSAKVKAFAGEMDQLKGSHDKALTAALKGKARAEQSAAGLTALAKTFGPNACTDLEAADRSILKELAR